MVRLILKYNKSIEIIVENIVINVQSIQTFVNKIGNDLWSFHDRFMALETTRHQIFRGAELSEVPS